MDGRVRFQGGAIEVPDANTGYRHLVRVGEIVSVTEWRDERGEVVNIITREMTSILEADGKVTCPSIQTSLTYDRVIELLTEAGRESRHRLTPQENWTNEPDAHSL